MKRLFAVLFLSAMLMGAIYACGGGDDSGNDQNGSTKGTVKISGAVNQD